MTRALGAIKHLPPPAFELKDRDGRSVRQEKLEKTGPVALVFFRPADWWTFCQTQWGQTGCDVVELE